MSAARALVSPLLPGRRHGCRRWSLEYARIDSESSVRATGDPNGCCDDGLFSGYPPCCLPRSLPRPLPQSASQHPVPPVCSYKYPTLVVSAADFVLTRGRQSQQPLSVTCSFKLRPTRTSNPQILNRSSVCFHCVSSQLQRASKKRSSTSSRS